MPKLQALDDGEDERLEMSISVLDEILANKKQVKQQGGAGSGFEGHRGRPGKRGGSLPRSGGAGESVDDSKSAVKWKESDAKTLIRESSKLPAHLKGYITVYSEKEYSDMNAKIFTSEDGKSGYAIKPNGELISVYSTARGRGRQLMESAVANGATSLDCYEEPKSKHLTSLYGDFGFKETERLKWDDQYAPDGWDYEKNDNPDVVFMKKES